MSTGKNNNALHKEVLGGIVTANGFFTGAVFLSITGTVTPLSGIPRNSMAGDDMTLKLFVFQVWSLGFYLLSSLIATATKLVVVYFDTDDSKPVYKVVPKEQDRQEPDDTYVHSSRSRAGTCPHHSRNLATILAPYVRPLMLSSVVFSAGGSLFMLLSIINLVQIKLGLLSCGSTLVVISVVGIALVTALGLAVYLIISGYFLKHVK